MREICESYNDSRIELYSMARCNNANVASYLIFVSNLAYVSQSYIKDRLLMAFDLTMI